MTNPLTPMEEATFARLGHLMVACVERFDEATYVELQEAALRGAEHGADGTLTLVGAQHLNAVFAAALSADGVIA